MDAQLRNWETFVEYHVNCDWYGIWTRYSPDGKVTDSFQGIRSFHTHQNGSEVTHQNHFKYADGSKETKTFGPYKKPNIKALFLENSFYTSSPKFELGSIFGIEIGFRYENKRSNVVVIYDENGNLQKITFINEKLVDYPKSTTHLPPQEISQSWQGKAITMNSDLLKSEPIVTTWQPLTTFTENNQILHLSETVAISFSTTITNEKEFIYIKDWLARPSLLLRGICKYNAGNFMDFTLETFNLIDEI